MPKHPPELFATNDQRSKSKKNSTSQSLSSTPNHQPSSSCSQKSTERKETQQSDSNALKNVGSNCDDSKGKAHFCLDIQNNIDFVKFYSKYRGLVDAYPSLCDTLSDFEDSQSQDKFPESTYIQPELLKTARKIYEFAVKMGVSSCTWLTACQYLLQYVHCKVKEFQTNQKGVSSAPHNCQSSQQNEVTSESDPKPKILRQGDIEIAGWVSLRLAMKHEDSFVCHYLKKYTPISQLEFSEDDADRTQGTCSDSNTRIAPMDLDSAYQVLLDQIMEVIFLNGILDLEASMQLSQEQLNEQLNTIVQIRESEILVACGFVLRSRTCSDVVKMLISSSGANPPSNSLVSFLCRAATEFLVERPSLFRDLVTSFDNVHLFLAAILISCDKLSNISKENGETASALSDTFKQIQIHIMSILLNQQFEHLHFDAVQSHMDRIMSIICEEQIMTYAPSSGSTLSENCSLNDSLIGSNCNIQLNQEVVILDSAINDDQDKNLRSILENHQDIKRAKHLSIQKNKSQKTIYKSCKIQVKRNCQKLRQEVCK